jgi:hypothetical protein
MDASLEGGPHAQEDLLISRIVDGVAVDADWQAFNELAARAPHDATGGAWRRLAIAQRQHASLGREVRAEITSAAMSLQEIACAIDDIARGDDQCAVRRHAGRPRAAGWSGRIARALFASGGWAVAASLVLAWIIAGAFGFTGPRDSRIADGLDGNPGANPNVITVSNADDALNAYYHFGRSSGQVLGEMPARVPVDVRQLENSDAVEVVYVRQFMERAQVRDLNLVGYSRDELGRTVPITSTTVIPASSGRRY